MPDAHFFAESPEQVGIDPKKLDALFDRAEKEVRDGLLPSAQIAVARRGKIAAMRSFGRVTHEGREAKATNQTLYAVFSSTKAITSAAAWLLIEADKLRLDERVADIIPEFGTNGKDAVTVEQLSPIPPAFPVRRSRRWTGTIVPHGSSASRAGGSTGNRARASSTTRRRACGSLPH